MTLTRSGGFAALICAATYVIGFALLVTVLAPLGYGTAEVDPAAVAAFAHDRPGVLIAWNSTIYIVNALVLVVLVVAVAARLRPVTPGLAALTQAIGLIWAGLVLGAGMIANVAVERTAQLYPTDPEGAAALWSVLHSVELGLGGGNEIAGGWWILIVSLAAWRPQVFSRLINVLGGVVGGCGLLTVITPVGDVAGAVFGLGAIVWFIAFGIHQIIRP